MTTENVNPEENKGQPPVTLDGGTPPAPATPPTPPAAPTEESKTPEVVVYEPSGDAGLDMALAFIGKQGLAGDHPAVQAAANGDFTMLKATLAQKGVQGYAEFIALGEEAYKRQAEKAAAAAETTRKTIYDVAGGQDEWAAVQKWASENATAEEKAELNAQLNAGGLKAKAAAAYLVSAYNKAGNVTKEPADVVAPNAKPNAGGDAPLTAREYAAEVAKLNAKLRGRLDGSPEYEALQRRRAAAAKAGR